MLLLRQDHDWYSDDSRPGVRYLLPKALEPVSSVDGIPQVLVARSGDGGVLHLRLGANWPELGQGEERVPFSGGRFRMVLKAPTAETHSEWRDVQLFGDALVDRSLSLSGAELAIARHLWERGAELVEVEVELSIRGSFPAYPWMVRVEAERLRELLLALLAETPASWQMVQAAFLGISKETFQWIPLEPRAIPPPTDEALLAVAQYAAPLLLRWTDEGWIPGDGSLPPEISLSLQVPRSGVRPFGMRWSFSEFLERQPDPGRHLLDLAVPDPFEAADLQIVNDLPLDEKAIRKITVEVLTGGPTGRVTHQFEPGKPSAARLRFVRETFDELNLSWRTLADVVTAAGPAIVPSDFRTTGLLIEVNREALNLTPLRFLAELEVFDHVTAILVKLGSRAFRLSRESPEQWAVGRRPPANVTVSAELPAGEIRGLGTVPLDPGGLDIGASLLRVGGPVGVSFRLAEDMVQRAAYVAVQLEGHGWRTLGGGETVSWPVARKNRLVAPEFRFRTRHVPVQGDGATGVMVESEWRDESGLEVSLEL